MFSLKATLLRQLLPHVHGFPILGVLWAGLTSYNPSTKLLSSCFRIPEQPHVSMIGWENVGPPKFTMTLYQHATPQNSDGV